MQRALKNARMPCSFGKHLAKSVKRVGYGHLANTGLACPISGFRGFRVSGLGIYRPERTQNPLLTQRIPQLISTEPHLGFQAWDVGFSVKGEVAGVLKNSGGHWLCLSLKDFAANLQCFIYFRVPGLSALVCLCVHDILGPFAEAVYKP